MKKYRWMALVCILCLLLSGCNGRKAAKQLGESNYLHTSGTTLLDAEGQEVRVHSKLITLTMETLDDNAVDAALAEEGYNSLTLRLMSDTVDITEGWVLQEKAAKFVQNTMEKCTAASRYLFVEIGEYPETYYAWYEDSDFNENVIALWDHLSEMLKGETCLGGYIISNVPRPGSSEEKTALEYYEELLQQIVDAIRSKDAQQMIVIGMMTPYFILDDAYHAFPMIKDANFAFAAPLEDLYFYTRQQAASGEATAHLSYPNNFWHGLSGINMLDAIHGSKINTATMDYQIRATEVFTVEQDGVFARIGANVVPENENGGGELRVLSVRLTECDADGKEIKTVYNMDSSVGVPFEYRVQGGSTGDGSVYDDGTAYLESISDITFFHVANLHIPLEKGKNYQLTVTMKQRGMTGGFVCTPTVQMYTCEQHFALDRPLIENNCNVLFAEADAVGVPLIYNDLSTDPAVTEEKGRSRFLADAQSVIETLGQNYIAN